MIIQYIFQHVHFEGEKREALLKCCKKEQRVQEMYKKSKYPYIYDQFLEFLPPF